MTNPAEPINHQSYGMASINRLYESILEICPEGSDQYMQYNIGQLSQFLNDMKVAGVNDELLADYPDLLKELYNLQIHISDLSYVLAEEKQRTHALETYNHLLDHLKYGDIGTQLEAMSGKLKTFRDELTKKSTPVIQAIRRTEDKLQVQESAVQSQGVLERMAEVLLLTPDSLQSKESGMRFVQRHLRAQASRPGAAAELVKACTETIKQFYSVSLSVVTRNQSLLKKSLGNESGLKDIIRGVVSIRRVKARKRYLAKSLRQNVFMLLLFLMLAVGFALTSYYSLGMHIPIMHMIIGMSFTGTSLLGLISVWFYQHTRAINYVPKPCDLPKNDPYDGLSNIAMTPIDVDPDPSSQRFDMSPV